MRWSPWAVPLLCCCVVSGVAADWPQYFGPNGDNSSPESIRTNWLEQPPREVWRKPFEPGFSSVAAVGDHLYTLVRRTIRNDEREVCVALNAATGAELWATDLHRADYTNLSGYDDRMDGPRSTPTVEGDRLYVFTSALQLFCLRTDDGGVIWSRDFPAELGSTSIAWENAASPLVVGDLIMVNGNASGRRLMGIRKANGITAWSAHDDVMTHASPVFARIGDVPQAIFLTRSGLVSVAPETGALLWRLPFAPAPTSTASSPAVIGEYVFASANYGAGAWAARVQAEGGQLSATQAWRQQGTGYQLHWSTPVRHEGFLYTVPTPSSPQGRLACLDVTSGANRWTQTIVGSTNIGFGSVIKAANVLTVLTERGELVLVQLNPDAYVEIAKHKVLDRYCWNHPTLANGRLYARSTSLSPELVALDVGQTGTTPVPPLRLTATFSSKAAAGPQLLVRIAAAGAEALAPDLLSRIELVASPDLLAPAAQWSVLSSQTYSATDGGWTTEVPISSDSAWFLQAREKTAR
jgi:outer membrane protein assembly factor BamB